MAGETTKEILAKNEAMRELVALQERKLEMDKKLHAAGKSGVTDLQLEIKYYEEQTKLYRGMQVEMTSMLELAKEQAKLRGEKITEEAILKEVEAELGKEIEKLNKQEKELDETQKERLKQLETLKKAFEDGKLSIEEFMKEIEKLGDEASGLMKAKDAAEALGTELDNSAAAVLGIDKNWNQAGLTGRMLDAFNKSSDLNDVFASMGTKLKDTLSPTNLLGSAITGLVKASKELIMSLDSSFAEFKQTTGGGDEYLDVLSDVTGENYAFGISSDEAMQSVSALYNELAMFTSLSKEAQTEIADVSAKLQVLGVDAQSTAKTADLLMQSVGYTKDEFIGFQQSLKSMSNAIKVPMATLNSQFVEASDIIGKYGKRGVEEFRKLAAAAKSTGIEMSSLLDIAGQFDTFEEAAEKVGSLNAILGGAYFDTVQMVNATEEERIDLLRRGVQASGKTFDQLGRYEKKAIAAAAGINDINEANKLFGQSTAAYEELQQLAGDASMSLSDLSEEAFNTLSPMQKLQAVMKKFQKPLDTILKLLDLIGTGLYLAVDGMEKLAAKVGITGEGFTWLTFGILGLLVVFKKLGFLALAGGKIMGALASKFPILAKGMGALGTKAGGLAKPLGAVGRAASRNVKGFLALGAAALMLGAGIALAAVGFAELVKSFKDLDAGEIIGALLAITIVMGGMILAIIVMGKVSALAAAPTWAFAGAILAIGAAVALAAYGISLLVDSVSGLIDSFTKMPVDTILGLMGVIVTLATLGVLAGIGLGAIAVGLLAIGAALIFITDNEIDLLARLFESVGSVTLEASQAIADLATNLNNLTGVEVPVQINTLMKDLGEIPDSQGLRSAATFVKAISETKPEAAAAADAVIKQAINLAVTKADSGTTELLDVLSKLLENSNEAASHIAPAKSVAQDSKNQRPLEIVVNIDGRGAWKSVRPYYIRELKGNS